LPPRENRYLQDAKTDNFSIFELYNSTPSFRSIINGIINIYETNANQIDLFSQNNVNIDNDNSKIFFDALYSSQNNIEELLARETIFSLRDRNLILNPLRQEAVKIVATEIADNDGKVSRSLIPGFSIEYLIISKEKVEAYKYNPVNKIDTKDGCSNVNGGYYDRGADIHFEPVTFGEPISKTREK
jgi:hypothetical protein